MDPRPHPEPIRNTERVRDLDDPRLTPYRNLRARSTGEASAAAQELFIAEGRLVVQRLLQSDYEVLSLVVAVEMDAWLAEQPIGQATQVLRVSNDQIRQLVGFDFHRGIMACAKRRPPRTTSELPQLAAGQTLLALCDICDAENIGSLIRTATAFGVRDILLTAASADPFSRRALRVGMGAALKQRFWHTADLPDTLSQWSREHGYQVIATTLSEDAVELRQFQPHDRPVVLLLGSEGDGLPPPVQRQASVCVTIPMQQDTDSLNVGVAAAIVLHHLQNCRRRFAAP